MCGITKQLTFHIARHTFATTVTLANGVPIESVSKMLGHTNIKTTRHYAKILDLKVGRDGFIEGKVPSIIKMPGGSTLFSAHNCPLQCVNSQKQQAAKLSRPGIPLHSGVPACVALTVLLRCYLCSSSAMDIFFPAVVSPANISLLRRGAQQNGTRRGIAWCNEAGCHRRRLIFSAGQICKGCLLLQLMCFTTPKLFITFTIIGTFDLWQRPYISGERSAKYANYAA